MRLTPTCLVKIGGPDGWWPKYPLIFGFGKGFWGPRKMQYTFIYDFKQQLNFKGNLVVKRTAAEENLPPGTVVYDARDVARDDFQEPLNISHPWPFQPKGVLGSKTDPKYKMLPALVYSRHMTLYEGIKGAMNFTNCVMEEGFPAAHRNSEDLAITQDYLDLLKRRLKYSTAGDSAMIPMPRTREFPKMNRNIRRTGGIHPFRKDSSVLKTFQDVSDMFVSATHGSLDRRRVDAPHLVVPFEREGTTCILDLAMEFLTATRHNILPAGSPASPMASSLFSTSPLVTVDRSLDNIYPADWRINFEETNFYTEDFGTGVPADAKIHTVFLSNNLVNMKLQPDRMVQARTLLYAYGLAVSQARHSSGDPRDFKDPENYKELPDPITIQLVYYNATKQNIGFMCFQLNTLSFTSDIKNQVWSDGPYDLNLEEETILRKMISFQLNGV